MNEENPNLGGVIIEEDVIDDTRFRVVFLNAFKRGTRIAEIREKVRQRFKLSEKGVERMFAGGPIVVKKDVGAETALEYKLAIDETGANCKIEVMPQVDDTDIHGYVERRKGGAAVSEERKTELTDIVEVADITKLVNEGKLQAQPGDVIVVSEQSWDRCSKSDQLLFTNAVSGQGFDHEVVSHILECPYVRHSDG